MGACFKRGSYHPPDPLPERKGEAAIGAGGHPQGPRQRGCTPLDFRSQATPIKERNLPLCGSLLQTRLVPPPWPLPFRKGEAEIGAGGHSQGPRLRGYAPLDSRSQATPIKEGNLPFEEALLQTWLVPPPLPLPFRKGETEIGAGGHPQGPRQRGYAPLDSRVGG